MSPANGRPAIAAPPLRPSRHIFCSEDARALARRRLPRLVFDFVDGATGREAGARRNVSAFDRIELQPRVLAPPAAPSLRRQFLGSAFDLPFGIAPMGMCDLVWPGADRMMARAAASFGIPIALSSAASSTIEQMRGWAGERAWFQLYAGPSPERTLALVERARAAGYGTLVLTVDVPQVSRRHRDLRNGFRMPFRPGPRQLADFALHPGWTLATLAAGIPSPRNFADDPGGFDREASRAGADWAFLDRLRALWPGRLVVKGVTAVPDALRVREAGADAIYVSTHGGRQLDSAPASVSLLPAIREALGPEMPLILDSGVRSGEDVVRALASGADFVMLGRPILYAIGAEGDRGLFSLIAGIAEEIAAALAQLGLGSVEEIGPGCLRAPPGGIPASRHRQEETT